MITQSAWLFPILLAAGVAVCSPTRASAPADTRSALMEEAIDLIQIRPATRHTEARLQQLVFSIGQHEASAEARKLMDGLGEREPAVLVRHEEGPALIPYVDVGAAARYVLREWRRQTAREQAVAALRAGDGDFVARYLAAAAPERSGMLDAVRAAGVGALSLHRDTVAGRMETPSGSRLAGALGLALSDRRLLADVIAHGVPHEVLKVLPELEKALGGTAALEILDQALSRAELASAAVFEIAALRPTLPAASERLWNLLADARLGGSAAAALARDADRRTRQRLTDIVAGSDNALLVKRARLALTLAAGDPASMRPAADASGGVR